MIGNGLFNNKKYSDAVVFYQRSFLFYGVVQERYPAKARVWQDQIKFLYNNTAMAYFKLGEPLKTITFATKAIDVDPSFYKVITIAFM